MRLLRMVNYEGRHCNPGGHWDMIRSAMSIKEEQPRGAHPTRDGGNAVPTATPRPNPEPCEHSFSPCFGKRNAVVKAQLSHNLKTAGAKNLELGESLQPAPS